MVVSGVGVGDDVVATKFWRRSGGGGLRVTVVTEWW